MSSDTSIVIYRPVALDRALGITGITGMLVALALVCAGDAIGASLDGIWRSRGYGTVIVIDGERASLYDLNHVFCRKRDNVSKHDASLFRDPQLSQDGRLLTTSSAEAFTKIYYDRVEQLPELCRLDLSAREKDPLYNFDAFIAWFEDYYAFAARRAVDFAELRAKYRPLITPRTTDTELLDVLKAMLWQLQDHHVTLAGASFRINAGGTPFFDDALEEYLRQKDPRISLGEFAFARSKDYLRPSWKNYLQVDSMQELSSQLITARAQDHRIGYLAVLAESGYSHGTDLAAEEAAAARQFQRALASLEGAESLILDMRINYGGDDGIALMLAGMFTAQDRPGLAKCTFDGRGFTPIQHTTIRHARKAFTGPVIVLSSPYNISSGENFMMMIKDFPNVLIVGDRTAGVHSDTLDKRLPNGWRISLSNEAFVAPDGTMYETLGVPPDVLVPYYPEVVRRTGVDPLMEKALHILHSESAATLMAGAKRAARGTPSLCAASAESQLPDLKP